MEEKIYQILENNGVPQHLHEQIAKGFLELLDNNDGKIFVLDGINGSIEEVQSVAEAKSFIEENFVDNGEIHPDIESLEIVKQIASVKVEEVEDVEVNGEVAKYCKIVIN